MKIYRFLSWGLGTQSTALAVMSVNGVVKPFDAIVTADTQWERAITYEIADFYTPWLEARGMTVITTTAGDIRQLGAAEHVHMPFWTETGGPLLRQCTRHFKIRPIKQVARALAGYDVSKPPHPRMGQFEISQGISLDEYTRMKPSQVAFIQHRYPLIELRLTRQDCIDYLADEGLPIPVKSACIGCPYRRASEYLEMPDNEIGQAITFDQANRHNPLAERDGSTADQLYIYNRHRSRPQPLAEADLASDARRERQTPVAFQIPMLCESGYCMT